MTVPRARLWDSILYALDGLLRDAKARKTYAHS